LPARATLPSRRQAQDERLSHPHHDHSPLPSRSRSKPTPDPLNLRPLGLTRCRSRRSGVRWPGASAPRFSAALRVALLECGAATRLSINPLARPSFSTPMPQLPGTLARRDRPPVARGTASNGSGAPQVTSSGIRFTADGFGSCCGSANSPHPRGLAGTHPRLNRPTRAVEFNHGQAKGSGSATSRRASG